MARPAPALPIGLVVLVAACAPSGRDPVTQPAIQAPEPSGVATAATVVVASATPASPPFAPTSAATAAAPATATSAPSTGPSPAPPRPPATSLLRGAFALEPAGVTSTAASRLRLTPGSEVVVDPGATFELELSARSSDARLVLLDAREDHVAATATREVGASTRLTLAPAAPLVPGSRYVLRLDGASDRDLHDDAGQAYSAVNLPLLAAGSPPPAEPKKQKPARKRRRR